MAVSHTVTYTWSSSAESATLSGSVALSGDGASSLVLSIPTATTNQEVDIAWTNSNLKTLFLQADQIVTIKSNSSGSPDTTLTTVANIPVIFQTGTGQTNPFVAANVTKLYVTNTSGSTATINLRILIDSTP